MEREKVIKGLEFCTADIPLSNKVHKEDFCKECPYHAENVSFCLNYRDLMKDALVLIKEQQEEIDKWIEAYSEY